MENIIAKYAYNISLIRYDYLSLCKLIYDTVVDDNYNCERLESVIYEFAGEPVDDLWILISFEIKCLKADLEDYFENCSNDDTVVL